MQFSEKTLAVSTKEIGFLKKFTIRRDGAACLRPFARPCLNADTERRVSRRGTRKRDKQRRSEWETRENGRKTFVATTDERLNEGREEKN